MGEVFATVLLVSSEIVELGQRTSGRYNAHIEFSKNRPAVYIVFYFAGIFAPFCSAWVLTQVFSPSLGPKRNTKVPFNHHPPHLTFRHVIGQVGG